MRASLFLREIPTKNIRLRRKPQGYKYFLNMFRLQGALWRGSLFFIFRNIDLSHCAVQ